MKTKTNDDWRQYRKTNPDGTLTRVFRGPNGWYVATEDKSGTHYQPRDGGRHDTARSAWEAHLGQSAE